MERYDVDREFWSFSDQLRLQAPPAAAFSALSLSDSIWSDNNSSGSSSIIGSAGKLAFGSATSNNAHRYNYFPAPANNKDAVLGNTNTYYYKNTNDLNSGDVVGVKSYFNKTVGRPANNSSSINTIGGNGKKLNVAADGGGKKKNGNGVDNKSSSRFNKTSLPASEALPRKEAVGGYIFVCNNETMEENLKRQLFGLPSRYRDSVRGIRPGLPLFLYNYSTHQLHGIFEATSFGGSNIDPAAWHDANNPGHSRFPAQVRVATRKMCEPLEEDAFRPVLHHYDGPKFRLELSVAEAISLLDIFAEKLFA